MTDSHQSDLHTSMPPLATVIQYGLLPPTRYRAMAVVILGITLAVLDGTIVNLALPGIARDLQTTTSEAANLVTLCFKMTDADLIAAEKSIKPE